MKNKAIVICGSIVILLGIFYAASLAFKSDETKKYNFMAKEYAQVFVRPHSPVLGSQDAQVYLVEFLDPECESCRVFAPLVKKLLKEFEGQVKLVVRYAPFHKNSVFAVQILEAARMQGKYWETLELLFEKQSEWGDHHNPNPELIWTYLPSLNLDIEKIKKDMEDPKIMANLNQDMKDLKDLSVRGTPTFFINGKPLDRFGFENLRAGIVQAIKELD